MGETMTRASMAVPSVLKRRILLAVGVVVAVVVVELWTGGMVRAKPAAAPLVAMLCLVSDGVSCVCW